MDKKEFAKEIYNDFFGVGKFKEEKLKDELNNSEKALDENTISKEVDMDNKETEKQYEVIDNSNISDESKLLLKKMIEYMRKYAKDIEKEYIPFNFVIYSDDDEIIEEISKVMYQAGIWNKYIGESSSSEAVKISLYDLEKPKDIEKSYSDKNALIRIENFEAIDGKDKAFKDEFSYFMRENLQKERYLTILVAKNKEYLKHVFEGNEDVLNNYFEFEIFGEKPDIQEVYNKVLNELEENNEVTDDFKISLLDYISNTYPKTESSYPEYRDKLCKKILFNKTGNKLDKDNVPEYEKEKSLEEIFAGLDELVGLQKVKKVLRELADLNSLKEKSKKLNITTPNLHMVFLGNPGTGKTTVARLVAEILYNLGAIKKNKLTEVTSKDLVAEYVGQTGPKTMAVVEKALGGVLFIDEAYSLASDVGGSGNSFNEEAIATLIQAMENNRDNLVVIFAGYTKEMQDFLNSNSGIVSRIGYTLEFDDYTEEELVQIFKGMVKKAGFVLADDVEEKLKEIIREYKDTKNFGNARFIRNVYEKTIIKHASNVKNKKSKKDLITITSNDLSTENLLKM